MTEEQRYADLLAIAKSNPETADFEELRLAYARSPDYNPYGVDARTRRPLGEAIAEDNMQMASEAIDRLLEAYYLDIEAHMAGAFVYEKMGDEARSSYHREFAKGLLDSIFQSGDGRSYQTAFVVIDVAEEYAVLNALGIERKRLRFQQSLREHRDHQFDVLELRDPQTGWTAEMYFNIDLPKGWLDRQVREDLSKLETPFTELIRQHRRKKRKGGKKWWQFWK